MTSSEPYRFEQFDGYAIITVLPQLNDSQWADIEKVGTELLDRLKTTDNPRFLVDLSLLSYMGSALVALIVRLWKSVKDSKKGRMVVVNQHEMVFEVLKLAGLHKVWTIVPTRDEGLRALGVSARSPSAAGTTVSVGNDGDAGALWTIVGLVAIIVAGVGLAILLKSSPVVSSTVALLIVVVGAAVGLIAGMISAVKETDWRQKVGIGVVVASVVLVLAGVLMAPSGAVAQPANAPSAAPPAASPANAGTAAPSPLPATVKDAP